MNIYALLAILFLSRRERQEFHGRPKSGKTNFTIPYKDSELKKIRNRYQAFKEQNEDETR